MYKVLRGRRAGSREVPARPADAAGRRPESRARSRCCAPGHRASCSSGEADYQLHIIYLWYERQTASALEILEDAARDSTRATRCSSSEIARIQDEYLHDPTASLAVLADAARLGARAAGQRNRCWRRSARAWRSRACSTRLHETDQAIEHLEAVIALRPKAPFGALALAHPRLGEAHDRLGDRADGSQVVPQRGGDRVRTLTSTVCGGRWAPGRATPRTPRHSEAYRLSLEGWRRLEKKDLAGAAAALERSLALNGRGSGRALPPRTRAAVAGEEAPAAARAVRGGDPRSAHLPPADSRRRLPRGGATARARRAAATQAISLLSRRRVALRRRRRHARAPRRARSRDSAPRTRAPRVTDHAAITTASRTCTLDTVGAWRAHRTV